MTLPMIALLFSAAAFAQSTDITGWHDLRWGSKAPVVLTALQSLQVHTAGTDQMRIEDYRLNGVSYEVRLFFAQKLGLRRVTMTAGDDRDTFRNALSELTGRYGKPGLRSEYDGAREVTRTTWDWVKLHGTLSL